MKRKLLFLLVMIVLPLAAQETMNDYCVSVRPVGAEVWSDLTTYRCDVDMHRVQQASFALFDMGAPTEVRVVNRRLAEGERVTEAIVRPLSKHIALDIVNDSTIVFVLPEPAYLSVEFNGDRKHNLHLFADAPLMENYTGNEPRCINWDSGPGNNQDVFIKNPRLIYFGPGVHKVKDMVMGEETGEVKIPSNTTVYLAPGAVVLGKLVVNRAKNVRIIGRGMLLHPSRGIEITYSKNVLVDGITVVNPKHYTVYGGQSKGVTLRNIKSFSRHGWSDGFDLMCCRDVTIDNVFLRNSDDCIALYNHRWWFWGGTKNIKIARATLWADVAHPFSIGVHGDDRSKKGEVLSKVRVSDCDILNEDGDGVFSIRCGDKNIVRDIRFHNIRVEYVERGSLFNIQVIYSEKYNRAPGGSISDIWFTDIAFTGDDSRISPDVIRSYDEVHRVSDIHFKNVRVNGVEHRLENKEETHSGDARQPFSHPGLLWDRDDLALLAGADTTTDTLRLSAFRLLAAEPTASDNYVLRGPFAHIGRDDEYGWTKAPCEADCRAAWHNAIMGVVKGDARHFDKARQILRAYADTLQGIHGHDGPLCAGLQGFLLVNAAEVLRSQFPEWTDDDTYAFSAMLRRAFLPVMDEFQSRRAYSNGNWGAAVNKMLMATAIFLDDRALYDRAVDFFLHADDNGALTNYIAPNGQLQESGRDQAHCQLGLGCLAELCEMAWHQGDDLYSAHGNRLLHGYEYTARYNLGENVPFFLWKDCTGLYNNWPVISDKARGQFRPVWELAYRHYVGRRGLAMPHTERVLHQIRPEGAAPWCDHTGFQSLVVPLR